MQYKALCCSWRLLVYIREGNRTCSALYKRYFHVGDLVGIDPSSVTWNLLIFCECELHIRHMMNICCHYYSLIFILQVDHFLQNSMRFCAVEYFMLNCNGPLTLAWLQNQSIATINASMHGSMNAWLKAWMNAWMDECKVWMPALHLDCQCITEGLLSSTFFESQVLMSDILLRNTESS